MSFKFELANVTDSFTNLYRYVAQITDENAWKNDPVVSDSATETRIKFPHPKAVAKDLKANNEPFSAIEISLGKQEAAQLCLEITYDNKKAAARFADLLQLWNKNIRDEFFAMVGKLEGFTFMVQLKTSFKNSTSAKYADVYSVPNTSVSAEEISENIKKIIDLCVDAEMVEDGKSVKYKGPSITICREFSIDDLDSDNSMFISTIKALYTFMLAEHTILSEKDVEKAKKERKKVEGKNKFQTVLSNRADRHFYCRLSPGEFQRVPENIGVQVWDIETFEDKKYIRAALKLVKEI